MDAFRAHDVDPDGLNNGIECDHPGADSIRQGRDVDLDPFAGIGVALSVQRLMQQELVDQHHRQQARPGKASRDRMEGGRSLCDRLAISAGDLLADMLDNLPAPRLAFQSLRYHLAKLVQPLAAALAAYARRGFDDASDWQIVRQRTSRRPWILHALLFGGFRRCKLGLGFRLRLGLSRSSMASSSCSTGSLPRSEDCPNCSRRALASISFSRSISSRPTVTSLGQRKMLALRKDHRVCCGKVGGKLIGERRRKTNQPYPLEKSRHYAGRDHPPSRQRRSDR